MNIGSIIRSGAFKWEKKTAIIYNEESISYREFDIITNKVANGLLKLGLKKGDRVCLFMPNLPAHLYSYYGIMKSGAIHVPANPLFKVEELSFILNHSEARVLITIPPLYEIAYKAAHNLESLEQIIIMGETIDANINEELPNTISFEELTKDVSHDPPNVEIKETDIASILYSSGTTGQPKGAVHTHRSKLSEMIYCGYFDYNPKDVVPLFAPLAHVFGTFVSNLTFFSGGIIIPIPRPQPDILLELLERYNGTVIAGASAMYHRIVNYPNVERYNISSVRLAFSGAAPLPQEIMNRFEQLFGIQIIGAYGLSECCCPFSNSISERRIGIGSIGKPIYTHEAKIVDSNGIEVEVGDVGELIIKGPMVMQGYYKRESDDTLRDGWLYTGDLAKKDSDGYFYIVDRKKDMILVSGFNVYPREVEEILFKHPGIEDVAVVGVPDERKGEAVKAVVVVRDNFTLSKEDIITYCRQHMAPYKVPTVVEFRQSLPKTFSGKTLKRELI